MVSSASGRIGLALHARLGAELGHGALEHVEVDDRGRPEAAPLDQDSLLAEDLARLQHLFVRSEHGHATQAELHELQGHEPVVDAAELDPPEADHVDLDPVGVQAVEQVLDQDFGFVVFEERSVEEVDADDAERLLLERCLDVEHAQVQGDLTRLVVRVGLELDAHPAVALVAAPEAAGDDGVGEGEERGAVPAESLSRSMLRANSWSSIACSRASET